MGDKQPVEAIRLSSATVHEAAGKTGALPSRLKPLHPDQYVCGPAFPVLSPPGDNLFLHHAIYSAAPGDVLVIDCGDADEYGYWGEVMAVAAQARGIAGLVITGGVRDSQRMIELEFPVFCGNICIGGTGKDPRGRGRIGEPVTMGRVTVRRGDLIIGDADGVVAVPAERAEAVISESRARDRSETEIFSRLRGGERTIEIYGLPELAGR